MTTLPPTVRIDAHRVGEDHIQAAWPANAGRIRRRWRQLTGDDLSSFDGSAECLAGILQKRYGMDRREALLQVYEFEHELEVFPTRGRDHPAA